MTKIILQDCVISELATELTNKTFNLKALSHLEIKITTKIKYFGKLE